jgi:hypothetical protein
MPFFSQSRYSVSSAQGFSTYFAQIPDTSDRPLRQNVPEITGYAEPNHLLWMEEGALTRRFSKLHGEEKKLQFGQVGLTMEDAIFFITQHIQV